MTATLARIRQLPLELQESIVSKIPYSPTYNDPWAHVFPHITISRQQLSTKMCTCGISTTKCLANTHHYITPPKTSCKYRTTNSRYYNTIPECICDSLFVCNSVQHKCVCKMYYNRCRSNIHICRCDILISQCGLLSPGSKLLHCCKANHHKCICILSNEAPSYVDTSKLFPYCKYDGSHLLPNIYIKSLEWSAYTGLYPDQIESAVKKHMERTK